MKILSEEMKKALVGFIPFQSAEDDQNEDLRNIERKRIKTINPFTRSKLELEGWKLAYDKLEKLIRDERKLNEYFICKLMSAVAENEIPVEIEEQYLTFLEATGLCIDYSTCRRIADIFFLEKCPDFGR